MEHQAHQNEIINYISNYKDWGRFFKIKRIYFRFEPFVASSTIEEFKV